MATTNEIKVKITASNETSAPIKEVQSSLGGLTGAVKNFAAIAGVAFASKQIIDFGISSVKAFAASESAANRLAHIVRTAVDATDAQVESLLNQAEALEKVGVVGKEAIMMGQGQLASFDLQTKSIERLIPSILNYAVAERGANLSGEELKGVTNGLAQALQGNFASLTKTGFVLDDVTKAMISTGTESERVAALVKVLDSTYEGLNEKMRETTEGKMVALQFAFGNLKEAIGQSLAEGLLPFMDKLLELVQDPQFIEFITLLSQVIGGVLVIALRSAFGWFVMFKTLFTDLSNIFKSVADFLNNVFIATMNGINLVIKGVTDTVNLLVNALSRVLSLASSVGGAVSGAIKSVTTVISGKRAEGGPVQSGASYLVGEQGPELFTPRNSGNIIPNYALAGGGGITINISGNTLLDASAGEKIADQIMRTLKRNLKI